MKSIRMEHTEGLGKSADVWVDGALLTVCDGISPPGERTPPGVLTGVRFRYTNDEGVYWDRAEMSNPSKKVVLEHVKGWSYVGYGQVLSIMPTTIKFDLMTLEDPNWTHDEDLVGRFVKVSIDRLEIVPAEKPDWPDEMK